MFEINDEYVREVSTAYWEEEEEMKMGIHPLQILERVQHTLKESGCGGEITLWITLFPGVELLFQ